MDQVMQVAYRMIAERASNINAIQAAPEVDPPPYAASDAGDSDEDEPDESASQPLKLTVNAAGSIRGNNNLVPTPPTALADAAQFSTLLLHAVNQINNDAAASPRGPLKVELTINCGMTVIGHRNVVGAVGLRPKGWAESSTAGGVTVGAKRKAEEDPEDDERVAKKPAVEASNP